MTEDQRILVCGLFLNSALYFTLVFVAGLVMRNDYAWKLAIAGVGFTFLCYLFQVVAPEQRGIAGTAVASSIVVGILAGLALLWKS